MRDQVWEPGIRDHFPAFEQAKCTVAQHWDAWVCCSQGSRGFREPEGSQGAKNNVIKDIVLARGNVVTSNAACVACRHLCRPVYLLPYLSVSMYIRIDLGYLAD